MVWVHMEAMCLRCVRAHSCERRPSVGMEARGRMALASQVESGTSMSGPSHINYTQAYMGARMGRRQVVVLGLLGSFVEVGRRVGGKYG